MSFGSLVLCFISFSSIWNKCAQRLFTSLKLTVLFQSLRISYPFATSFFNIDLYIRPLPCKYTVPLKAMGFRIIFSSQNTGRRCLRCIVVGLPGIFDWVNHFSLTVKTLGFRFTQRDNYGLAVAASSENFHEFLLIEIPCRLCVS